MHCNNTILNLSFLFNLTKTLITNMFETGFYERQFVGEIILHPNFFSLLLMLNFAHFDRVPHLCILLIYLNFEKHKNCCHNWKNCDCNYCISFRGWAAECWWCFRDWTLLLKLMGGQLTIFHPKNVICPSAFTLYYTVQILLF